jgi:hypothetical protein
LGTEKAQATRNFADRMATMDTETGDAEDTFSIFEKNKYSNSKIFQTLVLSKGKTVIIDATYARSSNGCSTATIIFKELS